MLGHGLDRVRIWLADRWHTFLSNRGAAFKGKGPLGVFWALVAGFFHAIAWLFVLSWRFFRGASIVVIVTLGVLFLFNVVFFATARDVPARALSPQSSFCADATTPGWSALASSANDEWEAVRKHPAWRSKLACTVQRHVVPDYVDQNGARKNLEYDLAFIEFQEDGKPYALRIECSGREAPDECETEGSLSVRKQPTGQLEALLNHLENTSSEDKYVIAFVHGWRHGATIGDSDVANMRIYAAHAARFVADRALVDGRFAKTRVTAVYIGWRGARVDEIHLSRRYGALGDIVGGAAAALTLFDRKPVSEAIAPSALAALRAIENKLGIDAYGEVPVANANKMIVFGHSLGGNMMITALRDHLEKKVINHREGAYMMPVLGDLVVLINPAAEASKWTSIQKAGWRRVALVYGERRPGSDYSASHRFYRDDQRPIVISATAARNWPPGGRQELDCTVGTREESKVSEKAQKVVDYDWATHDLFPAFKFDLRPLADSIERWGTRKDPNDECSRSVFVWSDVIFHPLRTAATALSAFIRVLPFMQTDPEDTRTIGNLDPPRSPRGNLRRNQATMRPFGTTHEMRQSLNAAQPSQRKRDDDDPPREIPLTYAEVVTGNAACPVATSWLTRAREAMKASNRGPATGWDTYDMTAEPGMSYPALQFTHGFNLGGIAPPTRANDPFWNLRAFDTALAAHNGYMLSSFICAMNQLVFDDVTNISP